VHPVMMIQTEQPKESKGITGISKESRKNLTHYLREYWVVKHILISYLAIAKQDGSLE
jgi:hypothetical protein